VVDLEEATTIAAHSGSSSLMRVPHVEHCCQVVIFRLPSRAAPAPPRR
jgi:hypothetical protein